MASLRCLACRAARVTAIAAEVITTRTPVAYAPPWASTLARKMIAIRNAPRMRISTSGRTARAHWGAIPYLGRKRGIRFSRPAIVDAAEGVSEVLMGEVGQCPPVSRPTRLELGRRDQQGRDETAGDQENTHDCGGRGQKMFGAANATDRMLGSVVGPTVDVRHDGDTCLEAGEAERKLGKDQ